MGIPLAPAMGGFGHGIGHAGGAPAPIPAPAPAPIPAPGGIGAAGGLGVIGALGAPVSPRAPPRGVGMIAHAAGSSAMDLFKFAEKYKTYEDIVVSKASR